MSGTTHTCNCGGEVACHPYEVDNHIASAGICANCGQTLIVWNEDVYEDLDFDPQTAGMGLAVEIRRKQNAYKLNDEDIERINYSARGKPDGYNGCHTCKHAYYDFPDGTVNSKQLVCRYVDMVGYPIKARENCPTYAPNAVWAGMGNQCHECLYSYRKDGKVHCHKRNVLISELTTEERGHCEHHIGTHYHFFERAGIKDCPNCSKESLMVFKKAKGDKTCKCHYCGYFE